MSRIRALLLVALPSDPRSPATWLTWAVAGSGAAVTWKLAAWLYVEFVRPRFDRFVRDSRVRSGEADDRITLEILKRNGDALDAHILGAIDRNKERFANKVGEALSTRAAEHGEFLRTRIFADEIAETNRWRGRVDESKATLDAIGAALEGVSAAQLAQGRALADMPRVSATLEAFARTIEKFSAAIDGVTDRLDTLSEGQSEMRGALDVVKGIVLNARPPAGVDERRHESRRAEDAAIQDLRRPEPEGPT